MSVYLYNEQFKDRFSSVIQTLGGLKKCSEIIGVTDEQIGKWRDGKSKPQFFAICSLAEKAGVQVGWLLTGREELSAARSSQIPDGATKVPMLGLASCGPDGWARLETSISRAETPTSIQFDKDAFAVIARGESMLPFGITEGVLCYCSPATELHVHDIVCIERYDKERDETSLTIKKLGTIATDAYEIIGYEPLEEKPSSARHGDQYQKLFWEIVPFAEIERISVVTHIHTRPSAF